MIYQETGHIQQLFSNGDILEGRDSYRASKLIPGFISRVMAIWTTNLSIRPFSCTTTATWNWLSWYQQSSQIRNWHFCLPVTVRLEMWLVHRMRSSISFVDFVAWWEHCGQWKMLMGVMLRGIFISICFVLKIRRRHFIWLLEKWGKEDWGWVVGSSSCTLVPDGLGGEQFKHFKFFTVIYDCYQRGTVEGTGKCQ